MTAAMAAGWVGSAVVLGSYALSVHRHCARWLHLGNATGSVGIAWSAASVGAWPSLVLTVCFGAVGWLGLWVTRR